MRSDDDGVAEDGRRSASPTGSSDANHNVKPAKEDALARDDTASSHSCASSVASLAVVPAAASVDHGDHGDHGDLRGDVHHAASAVRYRPR